MSPREWAAVLAGLGDAERRDALLMLSDEDWLCEGGAAFLREAARRQDGLWPMPDGLIHWSNGPAGLHRGERAVPAWLIDRVGRVDHQDVPNPGGKFTRNCDGVEEAFAALLGALEAGVRVLAPEE